MKDHSKMNNEEIEQGASQFKHKFDLVTKAMFRQEAHELRGCYELDQDFLNNRDMKAIADNDEISAVVMKFDKEYQLYLGKGKTYNSFSGKIDIPELGPNDMLILFGSYVDSLIVSQPRMKKLIVNREAVGLPVMVRKEMFDNVFPDYQLLKFSPDFIQIKQDNPQDSGIYSLLFARYLDPRNSY